MSRPLTEAQRVYAQGGTAGMRKTAVSRAQQIRASQRSFVYDGSLAPTCLRCGGPRGRTFGLICKGCS